MQKIKIGQLHGGDFTPTDFQDRLPDLNIYGLPFVFESLDEVDYVRSKMDAELEKEIASAGFVTFGFAGDFAIILSNSPVRGLDDLRGKKVWLPEGDEISDRALKRLQLVPSSKPLSDVMTGLKTGLFDVVAIPPAAAVALQWHTAVNYFTDVPVIYAMQFLAIRNNVFDRLSPGDQAIVSDVLRDVYRELDRQSPQDADNAKEALVNNGIEEIEADSAEFQQIRDVMADNNQVMARQGMFSAEVLKTLQSHLDQYRDGQQAEGDAQAAADSGRQ
jgi:TRAP-type C4-dicarboxylate transport system substrate-binding protein